MISLSSSPASGRSRPATRATSRKDGRRSGRPLAVISAGRSRLARCRRSQSARPSSLSKAISRCGMWFLSRKSSSWRPSREPSCATMRSPANSLSRSSRRRRMMKARTIGWLTPGSSASACRSRSAGTSRISLSSALPRALPSAAVPVSMPTSPMKSRGPGVARICSCPSRASKTSTSPRRTTMSGRSRCPALKINLAAPHFPARAERLQHGELPVVEFRKGDALRVAVKLLVLFGVGHGTTPGRGEHLSSCTPTKRVQRGYGQALRAGFLPISFFLSPIMGRKRMRRGEEEEEEEEEVRT